MVQVVCCECGEADIINNRCIGCGRIRPSSKEIEEQILKLEKEIKGLLQQLIVVHKLEKERQGDKEKCRD